MSMTKGKIIEGGRIVLPAAFRKSMGLAKGDTVLIELHGDEVRIRPARSALRKLQEKLRDYAPKHGNVSDELIAERRRETAEE